MLIFKNRTTCSVMQHGWILCTATLFLVIFSLNLPALDYGKNSEKHITDCAEQQNSFKTENFFRAVVPHHRIRPYYIIRVVPDELAGGPKPGRHHAG